MAEDISGALDRLQQTADKFISLQTNRRIQLGREKEARMVEAYQYLLNNENAEIQELETVLDSIKLNLEAKGVELKGVADEYKTIPSEELLVAANEGAAELVNAQLRDRQAYRDSLQTKKSEAMKVARHIDLFDEAIAGVDPAFYGDPGIVDAEDVAEAARLYKEQEDVMWSPEMQQRLEELQTESQLEKLQTDYYARLAREAEEKITASAAATTDAKIKIGTLEDVKKETLEGVKMMVYQPISFMAEQYRPIISKTAEVRDGVDSLTGKTLQTSDIDARQAEIAAEYNRLGVIFAPWSFSKEQGSIEARGLESALTKAGNGNFQEFINYLKKGHAQYVLWTNEGNTMAEIYKADMQSMFDIDISNKKWLGQLEQLWAAAGQADIEQATEALKAGRQFLPDLPDTSPTTIDPLLDEYGL